MELEKTGGQEARIRGMAGTDNIRKIGKRKRDRKRENEGRLTESVRRLSGVA